MLKVLADRPQAIKTALLGVASALLGGRGSSSGGFDTKTFRGDVRAASASATYQRSLSEAMAKDGPIPGDDGYTAGNAAREAYGRWQDNVGGNAESLARDEFLRRASVVPPDYAT
jgi:hypothetical protein